MEAKAMLRGFLLLTYGDLEIRFASPGAHQVLGTTDDSLLHRHLLDLVHPEERGMAQDDLAAFKEAKTLYGSVTQCRVYHEERKRYLLLDVYTNVVTSNLVFASVFRPVDPDVPQESTPVKTTQQGVLKMRAALEKLLVDYPLPDQVIGPPGYATRTLSVYDSDTFACQLLWPPSNFRRLAGMDASLAEKHVLTDHTKEMDEMKILINDLQRVKRKDDIVTKRFCTVHYFTKVGGILRSLTSVEPGEPAVVETVIDIQEDVAILICEQRNENPPERFSRGSSDDPRRMVPITTKIGAPTIRFPQRPEAQANSSLPAPIPIHLPVPTIPMVPNQPSSGHITPKPTFPSLQAGASSTSSPKVKACEMCHKTQSPEWRKGPSGEKTLCNACGLRYSRSMKRKRAGSVGQED